MGQTVPGMTGPDALDFLQQDSNAQLVDVRTQAEWQTVGVPAPGQNKTHFIEWMQLPLMTENPEFSAQLQAAVPDKDTPLVFLCKVGARSYAAAQAALALGYTNCSNLLGGFEGSDEHKGWVELGLPVERHAA